MLRNSRIILSFIVLLLTLQTGFSQKKNLTYQQAFGRPRLSESSPSPERWLDDKHYLIETGSRNNSHIVKVNAVTGEESVYFDFTEYEEFLPENNNITRNRVHTDDYKKFVFIEDHDLYLLDTGQKKLKRLTNDESEEQNPTFSPDASKIAFTRDHNLFVMDLESVKESQLTFDGDELIYNGWASWVYYEEILGTALSGGHPTVK